MLWNTSARYLIARTYHHNC